MSVTDEIKQRIDIVEMVSRYVPLKKAGRNYQGLCPFHSEKTPSFVVFPDSQNWHCFGACGTGGDVFTFVQKRERLEFGEALKLLAEQAGIPLPAREGPPPAAERRLERLREIVASAAGYFHHLLVQSSEAAIAREYLAHRGLKSETWEAWQLGYALNSWDAASDHMERAGYSPAEMTDAGLIIQRDDGSGFYDRFRGRLMIPIRDIQGRAVGFGARVLVEDQERPQPKYINSPQTDLFDKGTMLFGLDMARKAIREADLAVLVEGYMDVLMSHQVGVSNVIAGMGTALTEAQLGQLKRYSRNITLALDPDAAGAHAVLRGLQTARETLDREWEPVVDPSGLVRQESRLRTQLRIAALPDGLDPDELALRDRERWRRVIAEAKPVVDFYMAVVSDEEDLSSARGKANMVSRMAPLVREVANPIERTHYIQRLARLVQTDERLVAAEVQASSSQRGAGRPSRGAGRAPTGPAEAPSGQRSQPDFVPETPAVEPGGDEGGKGQRRTTRSSRAVLFGLEEHILGLLLLRPDLFARVNADLIGLTNSPVDVEDFSGGENRALLAALASLSEPEAAGALDQIMDRLPIAIQGRCETLIERVRRGPTLTDEKLLKELGDAALRLRKQNLDLSTHQLEFMILECETSGDREQLEEYKALMRSFTAQAGRLQKLLYARTMTGSIGKHNGTL